MNTPVVDFHTHAGGWSASGYHINSDRFV